MSAARSVVCLIYYMTEDGKKIGQKERINIPFNPDNQYHDFIKFVKSYANIQEQAKKRGLGERPDIQLARVSRSTGQPVTYNIPSQMSYEVEIGKLEADDFFQGKRMIINILTYR